MKKSDRYTKDFLAKELQSFVNKYRGETNDFMVPFTFDFATALLVNNLTMIEKELQEEAIELFMKTLKLNLEETNRMLKENPAKAEIRPKFTIH